MDLKRLRYFVAVAEELHFTRAAARLGIQQPPLSAQIQRLEQELGAQLLVRRARGVALTEAGKLLLEEARAILAQLDVVGVRVQRRARGETGTLNVGFAGATYLVSLVPTILRAFHARYPDVTLCPEQSNTVLLADGLREQRVDVAFVRPPIADERQLAFEPIAEEEMIAIVPKDHPRHDAASVRLADLADYTLILPPRLQGPGFYDAILSAFRSAGARPPLGPEASQIAAIPSMVAAGLGVAIVPRSASQLRIDHVAYLPLAGPAPRAAIALAYRRGDRAAVVKNFIAVARRCVHDSDGSLTF